MALTTPNFIQALSYGAAAWDMYFQATLASTGVIGSGDLAVTQNGSPNMSVNVAVGQVIMPGTLGSATAFGANLGAQTTYGLPSTFTNQGSYEAYNNATTNLVISAANPTNPRIDLVCASTQDAQYSGSSNTGVLQVITGTPAASPSPPSAPANTVVLAQVLVPAAASSIVTADITDERPVVALLAPLRGNPAGHMYYNSTGTLSTGTNVVNTSTTGFLRGGMTTGTNNGLVVPITGFYSVRTQMQAGYSAVGAISQSIIFHNGSAVAQGSSSVSTATSQNLGVHASTLLSCAAGDLINLGVYFNGTGTATVSNSFGSGANFVDAALVSI